MQLLDWQSDGITALLALLVYSVILLTVVLRGVGRIQPISRILPAALVWHLAIFVFVAFWLIPHYVASSQADAIAYYSDSIRNAQFIRSGDWQDISLGLGTDIVPVITGLLFAPAGADIYGILFFSAVLGFCGGLYFCRAVALWAAPIQLKRYAMVILFLPSFATWTTIFGKDSWICLGLGLSAYGYSLMLNARISRGLCHLLAGVVITTAIRPHISLIVAASMVVAYMWGLTQSRRGGIISKIAIVVVFGVMSATLFLVAKGFLGLSDVSAGGVEAYAAQRSVLDEGGGSNVEVQAAPGVAGALRAFPRGIVRVMFEPFPWEVNGFNSALAAAENLFLFWYIFSNHRRLRALIRGMAREPYLLFSSAFSVLVLLMLSLTPNLGIISRQRAQMLPFLFAVLVVARAVRKRDLSSRDIALLHQQAGERAAVWAGAPSALRQRG